MMNIRTENYNIPFNSHKLYGVFVDDDDEIETLVTHDASFVDLWIANIEDMNKHRLDRLIVGLDVECRFNFIKGEKQPVATLQLSIGKYCLIFQILQCEIIPSRLREFLGEANYTFVGVGVENDAKMLWRDYGLKVEKTKELGSWAAIELDRKELSTAGLKALVKEVLGKEMEKPKNITLSRWHNRDLNLHQVTYACLDAYLSFEIGRRLSAWY